MNITTYKREKIKKTRKEISGAPTETIDLQDHQTSVVAALIFYQE